MRLSVVCQLSYHDTVAIPELIFKCAEMHGLPGMARASTWAPELPIASCTAARRSSCPPCLHTCEPGTRIPVTTLLVTTLPRDAQNSNAEGWQTGATQTWQH